MKKMLCQMGLGCLLAVSAAAAKANGYPNGSVKIVVPYPAASGTDAIARIVAEELGRKIKQPVIVENRPGAGGLIGTRYVTTTAPNGLTLLMHTTAWPAQPIFVRNPGVSVPDALEPISKVAQGRLVLTVPKDLAANTFQEMVAYAKEHPGKLNYGTTGPGDVLLSFGVMQDKYAVKMEHIQYRGSAPLLNALVASEVQMSLQSEFPPLPFVKEGRLKTLAITGEGRSKVYPNTPTFTELGLPNVRSNWMGLFAPKDTPKDVLDRINRDVNEVLRSPETIKRVENLYFEAKPTTREELRQQIQQSITEWTALAARLGITPQ